MGIPVVDAAVVLIETVVGDVVSVVVEKLGVVTPVDNVVIVAVVCFSFGTTAVGLEYFVDAQGNVDSVPDASTPGGLLVMSVVGSLV